MALKQTRVFQTEEGLSTPVENCYIRVEDMAVVNKSEAIVGVKFYNEDKSVCLSEGRYLFSYDLEGDNLFKQAYNHLKTLEEFNGAVDC